MLRTGATITVSWKQGGQPFGEAGIAFFDERLHIVYRMRSDGEVLWQEVHEVVELSYTEPHFGGKRLWFHCPHCGRRVAVLYCSEVVACRKCLHLSYRTESEDAIDRLRSKAAKIKDRLGETCINGRRGCIGTHLIACESNISQSVKKPRNAQRSA